jgi:hypothetical protein
LVRGGDFYQKKVTVVKNRGDKSRLKTCKKSKYWELSMNFNNIEGLEISFLMYSTQFFIA